MLLLHNTIMFAYLLANFGESLRISVSDDVNTTFEDTIRKITIQIQKCSPHILAGELKQLFLITINPEQFFHIIQEDTENIQNHIKTIESYLTLVKTDEDRHITTTYSFIKDCHQTLLDTINYLKTLANESEVLPQAPPGAKPHFNRLRNPGELQRLRDLLIKNGFIPSQTLPSTLEYIFYGKGSSVNWQPIIWLRSVSELSYFIDMFFGVTDQKNKWRLTTECFQTPNHQKFNYNSLRGKQYNYISAKNSEIFKIIDYIRQAVK